MYQLCEIITRPIFLFHVISEDVSALQKFAYHFCSAASFYQFLDWLIKINLTIFATECISLSFALYFI